MDPAETPGKNRWKFASTLRDLVFGTKKKNEEYQSTAEEIDSSKTLISSSHRPLGFNQSESQNIVKGKQRVDYTEQMIISEKYGRSIQHLSSCRRPLGFTDASGDTSSDKTDITVKTGMLLV